MNRTHCLLLGATVGVSLIAPAHSLAACKFLMPLGGNGSGPEPYIVKKRVCLLYTSDAADES